MEQFVDKLLQASDQWITTNAINDKSLFKSTLKTVFSKLPSPFNETLSNNCDVIESLWAKIQTKYATSSNHEPQLFLSELDINEYLNDHKDAVNKQKALQSQKASLIHYSNSKINPFFKPYHSISYQHMNQSLDIALSNKQCSDESLSLIQFRFIQLLSNKPHSKKVSTKSIRMLSQKLYRLFCHNLGTKCIHKQRKPSVALLFNQIVLLCTDNVFCKVISMNILSFIRVFFDYNKESQCFEAIQGSTNVTLLITKLFDVIMKRYDSLHHWSNTQRLIFLWTVYECAQNGSMGHKNVLKVLKWSDSMWCFNGLITVFGDISLESFADFTNAIYEHNMLSSLYEDEAAFLSDDEDNDDDDSEEGMDVMDMDQPDAMIANINEVKDEDLFVIDIDDNNESS